MPFVKKIVTFVYNFPGWVRLTLGHQRRYSDNISYDRNHPPIWSSPLPLDNGLSFISQITQGTFTNLTISWELQSPQAWGKEQMASLRSSHKTHAPNPTC